MEDGLLFHYRDKNKGIPAGDTVIDDRARKFGLKLWERVDQVCDVVFEIGICPTK